MKVWIHINGIQEGPFPIENLPLDRMGADTPVWYNGLPDWMPACQAPEVARVLAAYQATQPACDGCEPQPEPGCSEDAKPEEENRIDADSAPEPASRPQQPGAPGQDPVNPYASRQPQQGWGQPQPGWRPQQQGWQQPQQGWRQPIQQEYQPWRVPVGPDGVPLKCPPTYLVWSILLTVVCCNPVGIVAIIYGAGIKSKFYSGDIEGARRASETTSWWLAITIVTGLILTCCMGLII